MNQKLQISQILVYYDTAELFVSTDNVGTNYICMLFEADEDESLYLTTPLSKDRLSNFICGNIDLYDIYTMPEIDKFLIVSVSSDREIITKKTDLVFKNIKEDWLPATGFYLKNPFLDDSEIIKESLEKNNAVVHLAVSDHKDDLGIDTDDLGDLLKLYSVLVENSYKKVLQNKNVKQDKRKEFIVPINYKLRAFTSSAASFNIHLFSESQIDLFGNCLIEFGLEKIDQIFTLNAELDKQIEILRELKGHTIKTYSKILNKISNDNLKIKHKWFAPNRDAIQTSIIDKEKADKILDILNTKEDLIEEVKEFTGFFVQVDISRKTWKLRLSEENKTIYGEANNQDDLKGITIETIEYKIVCQEIIEELTVVESEKIKYIFKSVEQISK